MLPCLLDRFLRVADTHTHMHINTQMRRTHKSRFRRSGRIIYSYVSFCSRTSVYDCVRAALTANYIYKGKLLLLLCREECEPPRPVAAKGNAKQERRLKHEVTLIPSVMNNPVEQLISDDTTRLYIYLAVSYCAGLAKLP